LNAATRLALAKTAESALSAQCQHTLAGAVLKRSRAVLVQNLNLRFSSVD
jgi:hypothetical protein